MSTTFWLLDIASVLDINSHHKWYRTNCLEKWQGINYYLGNGSIYS